MVNFWERLVQRFQKALSEPGIINDVLTMAERNTEVDRIYTASGKTVKNIKMWDYDYVPNGCFSHKKALSAFLPSI